MKSIKFLLFALILISQALAQNGAWYQMSDVPSTMKRGCCICWGGSDTIYALKGNNTKIFYAYMISQNTWVEKPSWTNDINVDTGGSIIYAGNNTLYAICGKKQYAFFRYQTGSNQWTQLRNAPGQFYLGAALCWTGGDIIYAFQGGTRNFYKYSIQGNSWQTQQIPENVPAPLAGASMCFYDYGECIYIILGGSTTNFYRYYIEFGIWELLPSPVSGWKAGASLVWDGRTKIYGVMGNDYNTNRDTMLVYDISTNNWKDTIITPEVTGGLAEGAGILAWDNRKQQSQLYLEVGNGSNNFYRYCLLLSMKLPFGQDFDAIQFPPPGWQSKPDEEDANIWERTTDYSGTTPYPNTAVAKFEPGTGYNMAQLITPKFYVGTRPALVKVQFYMYNTAETPEGDELIIEYYKPSISCFVPVATIPRYDPNVPLWNRKEVIFVETDTLQISFHGIDNDPLPLYIDSITVSIDTNLLYSNTSFATAANQSHLLTRKPETERLHALFRTAILDANGTPDGRALLYYSFSDDGENWSSLTLIDTTFLRTEIRSVASIAMGVFDSKEPWVVYNKAWPGDPQYNPVRIMAAVQRQNGTWKKMQLYYTADRIVELSMAMGLTQGQIGCGPDLAYVVAVTQLSSKVIFFAFDTTGIIPNTFTALDPYEMYEYRNTSIAITPMDYIHIVYRHIPYDDPNLLYYRTLINPTDNYQTKTCGIPPENWTDRFRVSYHPDMPYLEPASYPSIEAYGKSVFVLWRGRNENEENIGEIWRRERDIGNPPNDWFDPENKSRSPNQESHYPVMSTNEVTAFQENKEEEPRNKEIYANFWENYIENISETDSFSFFPHIDAEVYTPPYRPPYPLPVNTIWTERLSDKAYEIKSRRYIYPAEGKLEYYTIETGDSVQSPYCLQRDGFISYTQLPIDFGNQKLLYELSYLHPNYHHKIKAVVYQLAGGRFRQNFTIDSIPLGSIEYEPGIAETIEIVIPKSAYQTDSKAILEITKNQGRFVTLAKPLIVYQYEIPETTSSSGPQSAGQITVLTKPRLYQNYPNPFKTQTAIRYSLPAESKVSLRIYNISGRLVRTLVNQLQQSDIYSVNWDGKDNLGKTVSSGVYFYRLETDNYQTTNRAIIIR